MTANLMRLGYTFRGAAGILTVDDFNSLENPDNKNMPDKALVLFKNFLLSDLEILISMFFIFEFNGMKLVFIVGGTIGYDSNFRESSPLF